MYLTKHAKTYRICLAVFFGLSVLYTLTFGRFFSSYVLLVTTGTLCIILYESYPLNLVFSMVFVAGLCSAFAVSLSSFSPGSWMIFVAPVATAIIGALFSIIGSHLSKIRNELVAQYEVNRQLAENVVKLTQANVSSLGLAASVEDDSRTSERRRLAREIHDLVGYTLTTNITLMEAVKLMAKTEPDKIPEYVETIRHNTEESLEEIRAVLRNLHSKEENTDLASLLAKLRKVFSFSTGVEVTYEYGNVTFGKLEQFKEVLYHFVQEALINAFRHGKATSATVFFWQNPRDVDITVEDNGIGASSFEEDIGIKGMRERAAKASGTVTIPRVRMGFKIKLTLPSNGEFGTSENTIAHRR